MIVFVANRVSSGPLEGVIFLLSLFAVVVLLVLLLAFGAFLIRFTVRGKSALGRFSRACLSLVLVVFIVGSPLFAVLRYRNRPNLRVVRSTVGEIYSLESGITAFNTRFGVNPPSLLHLCENPEDWGSEPYSRRIIKRIWPQFNFALERDLNRDGDSSDRILIDGAECLVFFLGGVVDPDSGQLRGFSKNPANPFAIDNATRDGPFFEFDGLLIDRVFAGRLIDTDGDEFPEYADQFHGVSWPEGQVPYIYLSSYYGAGYSEADVDAVAHLSASPLKSWYVKRPDAPFKPDSYQIISAGPDGLFGDGGLVENVQPAWYEVKPERGPEYDNVTNFYFGRLGDLAP